MIVQKLFSSQQKQLSERPAFKKPVHKTYRQLLQLDRPRKKIQYQESQEQEDFLQKLLNEEKKKADKKKRKNSSRKNTQQSGGRPKPEKARQDSSKKQKRKKQEGPKLKKEKVLDEIDMFLAQAKQISMEKPAEAGDINPEDKTKQLKSTKSKSLANIRTFQRTEKSKAVKKDIAMSNPIFIDTKSIQSPPVLFTSASHLFNNTLPAKNQTYAYQQLSKQKDVYQRRYKTPTIEQCQSTHHHHIQHKISGGSQYQNFQFQPNIQPLSPNWRMALTFNPLAGRPPKEVKDRKKLFKNDREEERFIQSLRELSRTKK